MLNQLTNSSNDDISNVQINFIEVEDLNDKNSNDFCLSRIQVIMQLEVCDKDSDSVELIFQTSRINGYEVNSKLILNEDNIFYSSGEQTNIDDVINLVSDGALNKWKTILSEATQNAQKEWDKYYESINSNIKNNIELIEDELIDSSVQL